MKAFAITLSSLVALLAGKTLAAPAAGADVQKRFDASFSLYSPDDSSYFLSVPTDHQSHPIDNDAVVSHIYAVGGGFCTFFGSQGGNTVVYGEGDFQVDPPQPQSSVICDNA